MKLKLAIFWILTFLWAALIFYLSSIPNLEVTSETVPNFITRKLAHLGEYAILAILIFRSRNLKGALLAILLATIYGISDEVHQTFVPTREFHFTDIGFDFVGSFLGVYILDKIKDYGSLFKKR